jgi:hypothetical protein
MGGVEDDPVGTADDPGEDRGGRAAPGERRAEGGEVGGRRRQLIGGAVGDRAGLEDLGEGVGGEPCGGLAGEHRPVEAGEDPAAAGVLTRGAGEEIDAHADAPA